MDERNKVGARAFSEAFARAISAALAQVTKSPWPLEVTDNQELPTRESQKLPFRLTVEGGLRGECFVEFYEPMLSDLAAKLRGPQASDESPSERTKMIGPVLRAATNQLKSELAAQYGELTFKIEFVPALACGGMFVVPLRMQADRSPYPSIFLYFDGGLLEALSAAAGTQGQPAAAAGQLQQPSNLRLVMDVELNVSLRFGQCELPLREVLELTSGSVIELDRLVDEPVEMLLDGKVVARGEAVIVDGNYGLRVTEIPQAMETHLLH